jgi:outer membrane protein assembly factor BamB
MVLTPRGDVVWLGTVGRSEPRAVALSPSGKRLWKINPFGYTKGLVSLAVVPGRLYATIVGPATPLSTRYIDINIVGDHGQLKRHFSVPPSSPAIGPTGTIYYDPQGGLQAISPRGRVLWRRQLGFSAAPMVGKDGVVYAKAGTVLVAYSPSGKRLWRITEPDGALSLAERGDGTILVLGEQSVSAVQSNGKPEWTVDVGKTVGPDERGSLIVDAAGKAYVGTAAGQVKVVSQSGRLLSSESAGGKQNPPMSPPLMLGPSGKLVVNGTDGLLRIYGS